MTDSFVQRFSEAIVSFYVYYANLLLGWRIVSFIYLYQSTDTGEISNRFVKWIVFEPHIIGIGILFTLFLLIINKVYPLNYIQKIPGFLKQLKIQSLFLAILFLNYLAIILDYHLDIYELGIFSMAIWILKKWGSVFYDTKRPGWRHPTTHGTFFVSALLIGCSLVGIFNLIPINSSLILYFLLALLSIDLFILYARFQYLSKSGEPTIHIARQLMGQQLIYFGSRIIIGIFMPAIFILYIILVNGGDLRGIEMLILIGTLIDRILFLHSTDLAD